jgi:hypothetical protein
MLLVVWPALYCSLSVAQSPAPLSIPDLQLHHAGYVLASVTLPDGSRIVAGAFSSLNGVSRSSLAKVMSDGTVDSSWNPNVTGTSPSINAVAVDGAGNLYVGGFFESVNGFPRSNLARLKPDGSVDQTWNPSPPNNTVSILALDGTGDLFVAGYFTSIGGEPIASLAKLSTTDASVDVTWNPAPDGQVDSLVYDGTYLFVGGEFANIGGQSRNYLAKLDPTGAGLADETWNPQPDAGQYHYVGSLLLDGSGNLYIGGLFSSIGGQSRTNIARLSTTGAGDADSSWNPSPAADSFVKAMALDGSGNVYVGGNFASIGGSQVTNLARLSTEGTGSADGSWNPAPDFNVYSIALSLDGNVVIGGTFLNVGGERHLGFAEVSPAGVVSSSTPDAERPARVSAVAVLPDNSMIVGGYFLKSGEHTRKNILRVNADGTLDQNWDAPADQYVQSLALDGNGNVFVGGIFSSIGGLARSFVAKVSATGTGTVDPDWNPGTDGEVYALGVDAGFVYVGGTYYTIDGHGLLGGFGRVSSDGAGALDTTWNPISEDGFVVTMAFDGSGNVYAGGEFLTGVGGAIINLARFPVAGSGAADESWTPNPSPTTFPTVWSLCLDGNGGLFVGGTFTSIGGQGLSYVAKVSTSGAGNADPSWNPAANARVYALAPDGSGNIYVGGRFTSIGGLSRNYAGKISMAGNGVADSSWNPSPDSFVRTLARAGDDKILAGGDFATIGTELRDGFAEFANDVTFSNGFEGQ